MEKERKRTRGKVGKRDEGGTRKTRAYVHLRRTNKQIWKGADILIDKIGKHQSTGRITQEISIATQARDTKKEDDAWN